MIEEKKKKTKTAQRGVSIKIKNRFKPLFSACLNRLTEKPVKTADGNVKRLQLVEHNCMYASSTCCLHTVDSEPFE